MMDMIVERSLKSKRNDSMWQEIENNLKARENGNLFEFSKTYIDYKYKEVGDFQNGFAPVMDARCLFGFIDKKGNEIAPCIYHDYNDFSEGLAAVQDEETKLWGYISEQGKQIIPFKYQYAGNFNYGVAMVENDNYECGFIDKEGNEILPCKYIADGYEEPNELQIAVITDKTCKFGYFNKITKKLIPCIYKSARCFSEDVAAIQDDKGLWGYINNSGEKIMKCQYLAAEDFSEGLAAVQDKETKLWGYIDKTGKLVIPYKYKEAHKFGTTRKGYAYVEENSNKSKYSIIDKTGEEIESSTNMRELLSPQREALERMYGGKYIDFIECSNGLFMAGYRGKVIGKEFVKRVSFNEDIFQPKYEHGWRGKAGHMDREGNVITPFEFCGVGDFNEGMAPVSYGAYGFVDSSGKLVIPCQFIKISYFHDGLAAVYGKSPKTYSIVNGKIVTKDNEMLEEHKDNNWNYIDKCGNIVIKLNQKRYYSSIRINEETTMIVYADSEEKLCEEKCKLLEHIRKKIEERYEEELKKIDKSTENILQQKALIRTRKS